MTRAAKVKGMVLLVAATACGGAGGGPDGPAPAGMTCAPTEAVLPSDATLEGMAGRYRLVAFAADGRSTEGSLELVERAPDMRRYGSSSLPLQGTAEIDFAAIGATVPVDTDSEDPGRPGVLVLERDGGSGPRIIVRFGADMNDLEQPPFDGSETRLEPREIRGDAFLGTWRSAGGGRSASGYFCAWAG